MPGLAVRGDPASPEQWNPERSGMLLSSKCTVSSTTLRNPFIMRKDTAAEPSFCIRSLFKRRRSPTCCREVSSAAHVSSRRRVSSLDVLGKCLRTSTCLREDVCLRQTCLRQVSSNTHVASLPLARAGCSKKLASSFREVSSKGMCLQTPASLRCLRLACAC